MTNITVETREATNARMNTLSNTENRTLAIKNILTHVCNQFEVVYHKSPRKACFTLYIRDEEKDAHRGTSLLELWNTRQGLHLCTRESHPDSKFHSDWNFKYDSFPATPADAESAILNYLENLAE